MLKSPSTKKIALGLGIVVVLNLFFAYGIKIFYKSEPRYEDYCRKERGAWRYLTKEACEAAGGLWQEAVDYQESPLPVKISEQPLSKTEKLSRCDAYYSCRTQFEEGRGLYRRNVFIIWVAIGLLSLVFGFVVFSAGPISFGFSFGGVVSFIVGALGYWSDMDDYLRFIVLGLVLAVLIYLGSGKRIKEKSRV